MSSTPLEHLTAVTAAQDKATFGGTWRQRLVAFMETLRLALDALRAHKLRSFLTLLGVILAVATLVFVMSVVAGLNLYFAQKVANLGANVLVLDRFGIITSQDAWVKAQKRPLITLEEFERLRDTMQTASHIAATDDRNIDVLSGNMVDENVDVLGVSPDYVNIRSINVAAGRPLAEADNMHRAEVTVIGADVAKKFFANVDPIGKIIRAGTHSYQVVGVAEAIGSAFGQSQDNYMLIPLMTYYKEWHKQNDWLTIFIQARSAETMQATEDEARMLMRAWRHLPYRAEDDFAILGSDSLMALWKDLTATVFNAAIGIVSVFLVVGGIVIMNIMLASVTERTREIGIRRSLGARKSHILLQFVTESAVLAAMGGLIGVALAYGLVTLGRSATSMPMEMPLQAIILSLVVSTVVGLFFGIYPAMRAAKLDPIEALRAEN